MLSESPRSHPTGALKGTRILTRGDVRSLLGMADCIEAVEAAFRAHAEGKSVPPGVLSAHVDGGAFHLKAAGLGGDMPCYAAKLNGNFYANAERSLPRILGLVLLCDARNGMPLAVMDSTEVTAVRTAAATAVAARHLARPEAKTVTLCGCGLQGRYHLEAVRRVRRVEQVYLCDADLAVAQALAADVAGELDVEVVPVEELARATRKSDVCVTCTPSRRPLLGADDVAAGAFLAAVGADSEEKQELDPELLRRSTVVVDHLEQCATIGELHHALERGLLARSDVHGELHQVVAGDVAGRVSPEEIIVFDSTGVALEDVAAAALVYQRAVEAGAGTVIELFS